MIFNFLYIFQFFQLSEALPTRRKLVETKLMYLRTMTSQLDTTASWVLEVRAQVATAKHRPQNEKVAAIESIMVQSSGILKEFIIICTRVWASFNL